jgi:hypothetical protein
MGETQNEAGADRLWRTTGTHMNVLVDRRLPEQQPGVRDNRMLCVPSMENEGRLTPCWKPAQVSRLLAA